MVLRKLSRKVCISSSVFFFFPLYSISSTNQILKNQIIYDCLPVFLCEIIGLHFPVWTYQLSASMEC